MVRVQYLESFRAIAILVIVAGHCLGNWKLDSLPEKLLANGIIGGTHLFVFLSGFFLHHVFASRFKFGPFLKKKALGVFVPYLLLASLAFFIIVVGLDRPHPALQLSSRDFLDYTVLYFRYLVTGRVFTAYWYIPFIALMFLLTPVFMIYMRLTRHHQIVAIVALSLVAMVVQRPAADLDPLHSVVYFTPVYLIGITTSMNFDSVMAFVRRYTIPIASVYFLTLGLATMVHGVGNYSKPSMWSWQGIDLMFINKFFLVFLLLALLSRLHDKWELRQLRFVADLSLPLYFLHPWFLYFAGPKLRGHLSGLSGGPKALVVFVVTVLCCLAIAYFGRRSLGKKSQYLIG